jgi:regulator of sigma E protease
MGIVIGILVLSLLMIVHELGHFLMGRALKFRIEEFSIFMGPKLFSWTRKGILYSIRLFPIGAFVRFAGEEDRSAEDDPGLFFRRPRWARALVIGSGPVVNLLAGIVSFLILFAILGYTTPFVGAPEADSQAAAAGVAAGDRILSVNGSALWATMDYDMENGFLANTAALSLRIRPVDGSAVRTVNLVPLKKTGFRLGITTQGATVDGGLLVLSVDAASNGGSPVLAVDDIVLSVDGVSATDRTAMTAAVQAAGTDKDLSVVVKRAGVETTLTMKAMAYEFVNARGIRFQSGRGFFGALGAAVSNSASVVKLTFRSLSMLFSGAIKPQDSLSGPVGIVDTIGGIVAQNQPFGVTASTLLLIFALISVNLGIFNLLPVPALDGSQLVLIGVEAVRGGKRLPEKVESAIVGVGFFLIICLAVVGLVFDVMRIVNR